MIFGVFEKGNGGEARTPIANIQWLELVPSLFGGWVVKNSLG